MGDDGPISSQDKRLQRILFLLKRRNRVTVKELSILLDVSQVTIRADLTELERQGLVVRSYGAASLVPDTGNEGEEPQGRLRGHSWEDGAAYQKKITYPVEIQSIARRAKDLIQEGDVLFLDGSKECQALSDFLVNLKALTVFTSSLEIALALSHHAGLTVYILGGRVGNSGVVCSDVPWPFLNLHVTKAFLGACGATEQEGFTEIRREDADLKRSVVSSAAQTFILLRSSRWGSPSLASFAPLDGVDGVVTDGGAPAAMTGSLASRNIRLFKVESPHSGGGAYGFFESCRSSAREGLPYPGLPGKGKKLAFANGRRAEPFCQRVEVSILRNALLAGFTEDNILVLDNDYDSKRTVENARRILEWGADAVVEFNTDLRSNNRIAEMFKKAGIAVVALEGAIPEAPFVGANNWRAGTMAGDFARERIEDRFGSWSTVDAVILVELESAGELVLLRTESFAASLEAAFGLEVEERILHIYGGNRYETAYEAMSKSLSGLRGDGHYVLSTVNAETLHGAIEALKTGSIWSRERFVAVTFGDGEVVDSLLADGLADGVVIFHSERYGAAVVPAVCAILSGAAVPPYVYIEQSLRRNYDTEGF